VATGHTIEQPGAQILAQMTTGIDSARTLKISSMIRTAMLP